MSYQPLAPQGGQEGQPIMQAYAQPASVAATAPQASYAPQTAAATPAYGGGYQSGPQPVPVPQGVPYTANYAQPIFNGAPNGQPVMVVAPIHMSMTPNLQLPHAPCRVVCQHCQQNVVTRTDKIVGVGNWLGCAGCCIVGCWLGCFLIPFGIDSLKDTSHSCPHCGKAIALTQQVRF